LVGFHGDAAHGANRFEKVDEPRLRTEEEKTNIKKQTTNVIYYKLNAAHLT
jgi:hypothetical protein